MCQRCGRFKTPSLLVVGPGVEQYGITPSSCDVVLAFKCTTQPPQYVPSSEPTITADPSGRMAGEDLTRPCVRVDHTWAPLEPLTACTRPSSLPMNTVPSSPMAGDEAMGPPGTRQTRKGDSDSNEETEADIKKPAQGVSFEGARSQGVRGTPPACALG